MTWLAVNRVIGGALLVAGTCVGAGMLGVPISTAAGGFYPSVYAFLFCWVIMTFSALLMLEISLCYPEQTNLITMAKATLGRAGQYFAWLCYLLFLYSLMAAYTSGASGIIEKVFTKLGLPESWGLVSFVSFFAVVVYLGTKWVDGVNRLMMVCLIVAYLSLVLLAAPKVDVAQLDNGQPRYLWMAAPLLVTSFGFHLLIPSLKNYLRSNVNELRYSIILGSLIPLVVYLFWEFIVLGLVPVYGDGGLVSMNSDSQPVVSLTQALSQALQSGWVTFYARLFGFCAILTSFIGVSLGLFDFLADGFNIKKSVSGKGLLAILTFVPPALFSIIYPDGFLLALRYAGIFAAILLVMYPALMVWRYRYHLNQDSVTHYQVMGGKWVLLLVVVFGCGVITLEILQDLHLLPVPNT